MVKFSSAINNKKLRKLAEFMAIPYSHIAIFDLPADQIYNHIKHNRGNRNIHKSTCIQAIEMLQSAIRIYKKGK